MEGFLWKTTQCGLMWVHFHLQWNVGHSHIQQNLNAAERVFDSNIQNYYCNGNTIHTDSQSSLISAHLIINYHLFISPVDLNCNKSQSWSLKMYSSWAIYSCLYKSSLLWTIEWSIMHSPNMKYDFMTSTISNHNLGL